MFSEHVTLLSAVLKVALPKDLVSLQALSCKFSSFKKTTPVSKYPLLPKCVVR